MSLDQLATDQWSVDYYRGALEGLRREIEGLGELVQGLRGFVESFKGRLQQFERLVLCLAAGTWKEDFELAPKDGSVVLFKFMDGFCQLCYWDGRCWRDDCSHEMVVDKPLAWAEIITGER